MKTILAALLFAFACAVPAAAHDDDKGGAPQGSSEGPGPCKQDAEKLCPGTHPGDGKFGPCMKEHMDDVSEACRDKMKEMHGKMKEKMREKGDACKEEAAKACPDMHPGDGKFGPCLKEHKDQLSKGCQRMIGHMMAKAKKHHGDDEDEGKEKDKDDDRGRDHAQGGKDADKHGGDHDEGDND